MKFRIYSLLGLTTLAFACGADEGEKIETTQVHAIVGQSYGNTINTAIANANFLEQSALITNILKTRVGDACATPAVDGQPYDCDAFEPEFNLDDFRIRQGEVSDLLQQTIFQPGNVEASTETQITYLISGESVCGVEDSMFPSDCITNVNKAQVRLVVTSPEPNAVDIDVLVGPNRDNPLSLEFHEDFLSVEADLDGIDGAATYLDSKGLLELGNEQLPTTFQGRIRAEIKIEGPKKLSGSLSVLRALNVAGGDFGVQIEASEPTYKVTLDGINETLSILADLGKTDLAFPLNEKDWAVHLGGLNGEAVFSAGTDSITLTELGFGEETSTLHIDGQKAITFDINPTSGRKIDLIASPTADGAKLDFASALDIIVGLNFANIDVYANEFVDDDTFRFSLEGNSPSLKIEEGKIEVVEGTLKMSLENAGDSLEATAGQCISPVVIMTSSEDEIVERPELNPIESVVVGACD